MALGGAAVLAAPFLVSSQEARLAAIRALRAATGAEPQVAGAVHLSLLPTPAVRIEDVRLSEGGRPPFSAAAIRANVRLLPLFIGRVEIASLVFEHPYLIVRTGERGAIAVGMPSRAGRTAGALPEVQFENGTVEFAIGGTREAFTGVTAAVVWSGGGINASGSFRWREQPATFSLAAGDLAALEQGNRSGLRLRVEGADLRLGFEGGIAYRNGLQADGVVAAESSSLRTLLSQLNPTPPVTRTGFGAFKLKAQLALASDSASLTKLTMELDGNRAEGGVTIKQAEQRPIIQATLATDHADLTPYSGGFAFVDADGNDWSREPIDLSWLELFDLDMRFSAARVTVRKTQLSQVAATASLRKGVFTLAVGDARFHGGQLRGRAVIGQNADNSAHIVIEGNVADFELAPGLAALANVQRIEGKGTLALKLQSEGANMFALTRGLSGTVTLDAASGALTGVDIEQALRRLSRSPAPAVPELSGGRTAFERLNAQLKLSHGTAHIEQARIESPQVQVRLSGETSVVDRDFNLRGTAVLRRAGAENFALPFLVRGPWERPSLLPDPMGWFYRSGDATPVTGVRRRAS